MAKSNNKRKRKFIMPDAYIIIFGIVLIAAIATYILPSGTYDRQEVDGITEVIPDTYKTVDSNPANIMNLFDSVQGGLVETANLIFLVLIVGGVIAIIESSGAINSGIEALIRRTKGNRNILIASVTLIFGIICTVGVVPNVVIAFIPIGIALARALKLDAITGAAIIYLGYFAGNTAGVLDPAILGLAQEIAELPLFSGIILRLVVFVLLMAITIAYIWRYASKISKDPTKSLMGETLFADNLEEVDSSIESTFTGKHMLIIFVFFAFMGIFLYGSFNFDWSIDKLSAIFMMMGITIAIIDRINPNEFIEKFIKGAQGIVYGALVIGLARAVVLVLEDGNVMDTIVHGALIPLSSVPAVIGGVMLYGFNLFFNILVPSGTGQAAITMPLMVPIADMLNITRQTVVLALKLGDGISNIFTPTSGVLMAVLAVARVSWIKWFKFVFPLFLIWVVFGALMMVVAVLINYGPF